MDQPVFASRSSTQASDGGLVLRVETSSHAELQEVAHLVQLSSAQVYFWSIFINQDDLKPRA